MLAAAAAAGQVPLPLLFVSRKNQEPLPRTRLPLHLPEIAPMAKVLLLRSSDGKVLVAPSWDERPSATQALPLETGVRSRALERVIQWWTKHALAPATGESREALARWDADYARRLAQDGLTAEAAAAVGQLRLKGVRLGPCRLVASSASRPRAAPAPPSDVPATAAPADPATAAPSDVGATTAPAAGADPVRVWCRPRASQQRRLNGDHHHPGGRHPVAASVTQPRAATRADVAAAARADLAVAWCAVGAADPTTALRAAGADPVRAWCALHARVDPAALPDRAAASRARGRQWTEEEEESASHHRKRPMSSKACSPPGLRAPAAAPIKKVPATLLLRPSKAAASSLRSRRGLPELSCKCPQQNPLFAAVRKIRA